MTARRCSLLALVAGLVLAVLGGPSASAAAPTVMVKLTGSGPVPLSVMIPVGGQVVFVNNNDNLTHHVTATKGFKFDLTVKTGATARTPLLTTAGMFTYQDARLVPGTSVQVGTAVTGIVRVTSAPSPSPSPSPSATAAPKPSGGASPRPTASGAASPKPTAAGPAPSPGTSASPAATGSTGGAGGAGGGAGGARGRGGTGGSGTATSPLLPGFLGGSLGPPAAAPETGPAPNVAPPAPSALPGSDGAVAGGPPVPGAGALVSGSTGTAGSPTSGGSLAQRSPSRHYGLPAALAVVAMAGVLSLLLRLLLSEPAAVRRRSAVVARRQVTVVD